MRPLGKSGIGFGVGWTELKAVFNVELYYLQPWVLLQGDKGRVILTLSNITSFQKFSYDTKSFFVSIEDLRMGLGQASVEISGFGMTVSSTARTLTTFINGNKDMLLSVLSLVSKELVNACLAGVRSIILP
jgi:hypothetical protein